MKKLEETEVESKLKHGDLELITAAVHGYPVRQLNIDRKIYETVEPAGVFLPMVLEQANACVAALKGSGIKEQWDQLGNDNGLFIGFDQNPDLMNKIQQQYIRSQLAMAITDAGGSGIRNELGALAGKQDIITDALVSALKDVRIGPKTQQSLFSQSIANAKGTHL